MKRILLVAIAVLLGLGIVVGAGYAGIQLHSDSRDADTADDTSASSSPEAKSTSGSSTDASAAASTSDSASAAPSSSATATPTETGPPDPGPALYSEGDSGDEVRDVQARLVQIDWLTTVTGEYDATTVAAVEGFQEKREFAVTGEVDQRTLTRLQEMTSEPTYEQLNNIVPEPPAGGEYLDERCLTGDVLCIDKTTRTLAWVNDGEIISTFDVRFGREGSETREGEFSVNRKSRDHVSSIYHTSMPYAMFFSGGQAVHYSSDFANNGYNGASHGCVNVRDYNGIAALFDQVQVGDKVIVYWS